MRRHTSAAASSGVPRRRHRLLVFIIGAVLAAAAVGGALYWWPTDRDEQADLDRATAEPSATLSPERAEEIAAQMTSSDEAQLRLAVVLPDGQPLDPSLIPGLAGLQLDIDPDSYTPTGADTATVAATTTDATGTVATWTLELVLLDDVGWKVLATVPHEEN